MADQLLGRNFGGYEILEEIGRGGMAVVYKARQISMNRIVALKVLPRQFVHDKTFRARFEREVSIVAKLEHRAIVPVHDYGEIDELPFIVMRYMDSGSVDDLLVQGPLDPALVERIVLQIADGLDYAHSKGVLHRDLKPSNILLDEAGDAYLTDFGIAHLTGSSQITTEGVVGTPAYMSPEQAQGLRLDGRSDVYGLAVVTFEMLAGRRPYESETPYGIAVMHVTAPVPSAREVNPRLAPTIDHVLQRGMAKNRAERYQTAHEFAAALSRAIHASASEIADSTAQTKPVDLAEAHKRLQEADEVYVSAPIRQGVAVRTDQPTPPRSLRVARARERANRSRPWLNALLGILIGVIIFAILGALFVLASVLGGPESTPATPTLPVTPTGGGAQVTVVPLGPLHPAAIALTQTAEAAPTGDPLEALAASGGRIVFSAARDGEAAELFLLDLTTGLEEPLTRNDAQDTTPAVSPDGRQVAFVSDRDGDSEIFVVELACLEADNASESCEAAARQVTDNAVEDRSPAWTPDGRAILFASDASFAGRFNLYRISLDGRDLTRLTESDEDEDHPSASPDGRYVVYSAWQDGNLATGAIKRLDLRSGETITLADNEGNDRAPAYSPDGRWIVFQRDGPNRAALWVMDAAGGNQRPVYDGPGEDWGGAWSPDGRLLAFTSDESGAGEIYLIAAGGGAPRKISSGGGAYPAWVP